MYEEKPCPIKPVSAVCNTILYYIIIYPSPFRCPSVSSAVQTLLSKTIIIISFGNIAATAPPTSETMTQTHRTRVADFLVRRRVVCNDFFLRHFLFFFFLSLFSPTRQQTTCISVYARIVYRYARCIGIAFRFFFFSYACNTY